MQRLKQISLILSLSFLSSCNSPEIRDLRQLNVRLITEPCGDRLCINEEESACFSRIYRHSENYIGSVGSDQELPITDCHDVIGYKAGDYVDLSDFFEEVRKKITKKKSKSKSRSRVR